MSTCQRIGLPAGFPRKKTFASTVPQFALPHSALRSLTRFLSTPRMCPSLNFSQLFSQRTVPGQQGNAGASPAREADLWGAGGQGTRRNRVGAAPAPRRIMRISFQEMHGASPGRSISHAWPPAHAAIPAKSKRQQDQRTPTPARSVQSPLPPWREQMGEVRPVLCFPVPIQPLSPTAAAVGDGDLAATPPCPGGAEQETMQLSPWGHTCDARG